MNLPPEQVGAVPQAGVNPLAKQAPQGQGQQTLPPEQMAALRSDPEIKQAVSQFIGRPVNLTDVPDNILMVVAGMVHKLGLEGAIAEIQRIVPPEIAAQLKAGAQR